MNLPAQSMTGIVPVAGKTYRLVNGFYRYAADWNLFNYRWENGRLICCLSHKNMILEGVPGDFLVYA